MDVKKLRIPEDAADEIVIKIYDTERHAIEPWRLKKIKNAFPSELPQITKDLLELAALSYELKGDVEFSGHLETDNDG